jgi:hypothetical protein
MMLLFEMRTNTAQGAREFEEVSVQSELGFE